MRDPAGTILLIADDPADASLCREVGGLKSFEVVVARSLGEGRRLAEERQIAAVFLDLGFPGSGRLETVRKARAAFPDLPVVALLGREDEQLGPDCLSAGALDYLVKGRTPADSVARAARYAVAHQRVRSELQSVRDQVEERVRERTAELAHTVDELREELLRRKVAEEQLAARARRLCALAGEITVAGQLERRRLAKLLHDHLQQLLVAANMRVSMLGKSAGAAAPVKRAAGEVEKLVSDSIDAARALSRELSPPVLPEMGLSAALEWLAQRMAAKHGLTVSLDVEHPIPMLADNVQVLLLESVRELLLNTAKHAQVNAASVSLRVVEGRGLQITVSDSGKGFNPADPGSTGDAAGGFGIFSVRERLALIGGQMEVQSAPGKGCRLTLIVPAAQATAGTTS